MDDAAPPTRVGLRAARKPRWLLLNGGTVLFLCLFLPAMDSCGEPLYPIEFVQHPFGWPLLLPYLFGLAAAALAIQGLFFAGSTARRWHVATIVLGLLCYTAATIVYAVATLDEPGVPAVPLVVCLLLLRPALRTLRARLALPWQSARATWVGGVACVLWFGLFVVLDVVEGSGGDDGIRFGMWLSLAASIALVVAGGLLEQRVEPPAPAKPPPLPPARVEH